MPLKSLKRTFLAAVLLLAPHLLAQTLTLTANTVVMHTGDPVPPLTYKVAGYSGADNWGAAVASGLPKLATTATSSSPVGSYPVSIAEGDMKAGGSYKLSFVAGKVIVIAQDNYGARPNNHVLYGPEAMLNMKTQTVGPKIYGDCVHDDALAIQTFTNSKPGHHLFYFPAGCYLLGTRVLVGGANSTIMGDGPNKTIFKVAAHTPGFSDAKKEFNVIQYLPFGPGGNQTFFNYFENVGIDVGPGNPYAGGIAFHGSNFAKIANVTVWSEDGQGICGICISGQYPGPGMMKDLSVYGFRLGIQTGQILYTMAGERFTVENQAAAGIAQGGLSVNYRRVLSYQEGVPGYEGNAQQSVLMNAEFLGSGKSAITTGVHGNAGTLYLRDIHVDRGYQNSLVDQGVTPAVTLTQASTPVIEEHWTGTAQTLFPSGAAGMLKLPIKETPEIEDDPNPANWTALSPDINEWPAQVANSKSSTVYIPASHNRGPGRAISAANDFNTTGLYATPGNTKVNIDVPDHVNHIQMNEFHLSCRSCVITWNVAGSSSTPLVIEHSSNQGANMVIHHTGRRTVVLEDQNLAYTCSDGAGDLFLEDVGLPFTNFCSGQHIWARQLDDEVVADGCGTPTVSVSNMTYTATVASSPSCAALTPGSIVSIAHYVGETTKVLVGNSFKVLTNTGGTITGKLVDPQPDIPTSPERGWVRATTPKITCTGCTLWVLGYKSESATSNLDITNAQAEILGMFAYSNSSSYTGQAIFNITDSNLSFTGANVLKPNFANWVRETRGGETKFLPTTSKTDTTLMPLFYSTGKSAPAPSKRR